MYLRLWNRTRWYLLILSRRPELLTWAQNSSCRKIIAHSNSRNPVDIMMVEQHDFISVRSMALPDVLVASNYRGDQSQNTCD